MKNVRKVAIVNREQLLSIDELNTRYSEYLITAYNGEDCIGVLMHDESGCWYLLDTSSFEDSIIVEESLKDIYETLINKYPNLTICYQ